MTQANETQWERSRKKRKTNMSEKNNAQNNRESERENETGGKKQQNVHENRKKVQKNWLSRKRLGFVNDLL